MSYETNDEITMDAYIEEKINTKLPKLFFISQPMAGKTDVEIAAERTMIKERIKREINPAATFIDSVLDKNKVEKRDVEIGISDGVYTEITSGLAEGEQVITSEVGKNEKVGSSSTRSRPPRI